MIKPTPEYDEFCKKQMVEENLSVQEAFRIYDALHAEAVALGAISHKNIWEGFEVDLRITRAMSGLKRD